MWNKGLYNFSVYFQFALSLWRNNVWITKISFDHIKNAKHCFVKNERLRHAENLNINMFKKNLRTDSQFREKTKCPNEDCVNHNAVKHLSFTFWTDDNKISIKEILHFTKHKRKLINSLTVVFFMFFEETNVVNGTFDNLCFWSLTCQRLS